MINGKWFSANTERGSARRMTEWTDHRPEGRKQAVGSTVGNVTARKCCSLLRAGGIEDAPMQWVLRSGQERIKDR